jgi:hypothetical protein
MFAPCDSLELKVCLDIYRHMEQGPERILYNDPLDSGEFAQPTAPSGKAPFFTLPSFTLPSRNQLQNGTRIR